VLFNIKTLLFKVGPNMPEAMINYMVDVPETVYSLWICSVLKINIMGE
jgi:hypothetical protein